MRVHYAGANHFGQLLERITSEVQTPLQGTISGYVGFGILTINNNHEISYHVLMNFLIEYLISVNKAVRVLRNLDFGGQVHEVQKITCFR